ncbi:gliding motility-associated C-terminal domain-containing protein [Pseudozobellia sp. WGM2]|uniref:Ig-like domain-containing protein n=1 Tax=Pseudozobellia sp. WGM2 TaxID=2787625 RepID=UPI001ADED34F|nr:gliding motility-associated C-terminal domain-containing protein [Pseudozobellia sp. WGM2]
MIQKTTLNKNYFLVFFLLYSSIFPHHHIRASEFVNVHKLATCGFLNFDYENVVVDGFENFYPNESNAIKINRNFSKRKSIIDRLTWSIMPDSLCGQPSSTTTDSQGLIIDILGLGGAGVTDPDSAIDGDFDTYSELGLGVISALANVEQTFHFDQPRDTSNVYYMLMSIAPSLLDLGIMNQIEVTGQGVSDTAIPIGNLANLLDVDALGLLQNDEIATIAFQVNEPIDEINVNLSSLLGVDIGQEIRIYEVYSAPGQPTVPSGEEGVFICEGTSADLVATVENDNGVELRWYDAEEGGNLVHTNNSGDTFTTPILNADTAYYVASAKVGCSEESPRTAARVNVRAIPTEESITIQGNENMVCSSNDVVLVPSSEIQGDFSWFFDADMNSEITDGTISGGATYQIDENGRLIISGLSEADTPFTYYVSVTDQDAGCTNAPGDLASVTVEVNDFDKNVSVSSMVVKSIEDIISIFDGEDMATITGTVSGDVNSGEVISLAINGQSFDAVVQADSTFEIVVNSVDLVSDPDNILEVTIDNGICVANDEILVELPELVIDNVLQIFCATDLATIADVQLDSENLVLFDDLSAGAQIDASTQLVDGEVYFAGILGIPTSILARVAITIQIIDVPAPTTNSENQVFCDSQNPIVADIQINEENVVFYDSASEGNMIDPATPLVDGESYYVAAVENGCESSTRLRITVTILEDDFEAIILIGESEEACRGRSYTYTTRSDKTTYEWQVTGGAITAGGTTTDDFVTIRWTELEDTRVTVSYEDISGCNTDKSITLDVSVTSCGMVLGEEFCLKVFNEFSPNNDGFNEVFKIQCIENYSNTLEIYNRNGNLVYKTTDYQNTWTGLANVNGVLKRGDHLPSGTYYYVLDIPELERNLVGWLQLAR